MASLAKVFPLHAFRGNVLQKKFNGEAKRSSEITDAEAAGGLSRGQAVTAIKLVGSKI